MRISDWSSDVCSSDLDAPSDLPAESVMHLEVDEQGSAEVRERIAATLAHVLREVRKTGADWRPMCDKVNDLVQVLKSNPPPVPQEETDEIIAFLRWMVDDHFTFLGYREYGFSQDRGQTDLKIVEGSGLGILGDPDVSVFEGMRQFATLPPDIQSFIRQPRLLMVTKANRVATVHRAAPMDTVIVKIFDETGEVSGERMFVGLFTSVRSEEHTSELQSLMRI